MIKRLLVSALALGAAACGGATATSPTPTSPTPTVAAPIPTPTVTLYTLSGRVTDSATSAPVAGATVSVTDGANAGKSAVTDATGNYSVTGLQQAGFTVTATAGAYAPSSQGVTLTSNQSQNFTLAQRSFAGTWSGTALQEGTSVPIPMSFTVSAANTVTVLLTGICQRSFTASLISPTNTAFPPVPIANGRFLFTSSRFVRSLAGTFTSDTAASGTTSINLVGESVSVALCSGTYTLTWTATKQ
ncbi:MAG: carboxypeptidase-like regulatory domain-containing protein [Vicinamibacterales bacterium]